MLFLGNFCSSDIVRGNNVSRSKYLCIQKRCQMYAALIVLTFIPISWLILRKGKFSFHLEICLYPHWTWPLLSNKTLIFLIQIFNYSSCFISFIIIFEYIYLFQIFFYLDDVGVQTLAFLRRRQVCVY